jgi:hypothetical protein
MRHAGEIRSRGMVEGIDGEHDDAPFAVCVLLRRDWDRSSATSLVPRASTGGWHLRHVAMRQPARSPRRTHRQL